MKLYFEKLIRSFAYDYVIVQCISVKGKAGNRSNCRSIKFSAADKRMCVCACASCVPFMGNKDGGKWGCEGG